MNKQRRLLGALLAAVLCLTGCVGTRTADVHDAEAINTTCPRSGKPVSADSLTTYRGYTVGFCNTHCRDDFAAHVDERPKDRAFFDDWIARSASR